MEGVLRHSQQYEYSQIMRVTAWCNIKIFILDQHINTAGIMNDVSIVDNTLCNVENINNQHKCGWFGLVVMAFVTSTKLTYVESA